MKISQIKTKAPFNELFPINPEVLSAVKAHIETHGYDESQPIVIWEEEAVVVDGHSRLQAAIDLGLEEVPVHMKSFQGEDAALEYAIHNQRHRRNLTEAEILRCIEAVDKRREAQRDEQGKYTVGPSEPMGRSAAQTAKIVGTSESKVKRVRAVLSDPEVAEEVRAGRVTINKGAQEVRAKKVKPPDATAPTPAPEKPQPKASGQDKRQEVLLQAWTELRAWRQKYSEYQELAAIFEFLDTNYYSKLKPGQPLQETEAAPIASEPLKSSLPVYVEEEGGKPQVPDAGNDGLPSNSDEVEIDGQFADLSVSEGAGSNFKDCRNCRKVIISLDAPDQGSCEIYSTPRPIGKLVSCPHFEFQVAADPTGPSLGIPAQLEVSETAKATTGEERTAGL
jgi:ParB family chromosome partitioning protein